MSNGSSGRRMKVLLLHGNRQTGEVLLGRIDKLKKALSKVGLEIIAPDAPHLFADGDNNLDDDCNDGTIADDTSWQRTWWHRKDNVYQGLEESITRLNQLWNKEDFVGIIAFSQGSRLAHIISVLHTITNGLAFPGLSWVMHFSGYGDVPMPENLISILKDHWGDNLPQKIDVENVTVDIPSFHCMGENDKLIPLQSSEALSIYYIEPTIYVHPGSHFLPVKKIDVDQYMLFINKVLEETNISDEKKVISKQPDEEHSQTQIDEVTALAQIFPQEFNLLSKSTPKDTDNYESDDYPYENRIYEHPIKYSITLQLQDDCHEEMEEDLWPVKLISLCIQYTTDYPDQSPIVSLIHEMSYFEFSMHTSDTLLSVVRQVMEEEAGIPCVMSAVYAAREFFINGGMKSSLVNTSQPAERRSEVSEEKNVELASCCQDEGNTTLLLRPASKERIKECNQQGLDIATTMLGRAKTDQEGTGKGGRWRYNVGLVGKPSAGKSTFFNAATAFARQRGEANINVKCKDKEDDDSDIDVVLGGASMAPHPFTTIDPNVGYCLVPSPEGSCPEDDGQTQLKKLGLSLASTHGRDSKGRRLIPISLKDVAGLVPGAYKGRGRGNAFLNDLTDADTIIHVVDASGCSDSEGNKICSDGSQADNLQHPLSDLEWVRNELVEWVYFNISSKWESVARRGRQKLIEMFSGYKQSQSFTNNVLSAVEKFVAENEETKEQLDQWDEGDLHRLVSAFLGARFPMSLALNKDDIASSQTHINDIKSKLPIHGAHVGVSMSAHDEMKTVRHHVALAEKSDSSPDSHIRQPNTSDCKVWVCLQAAISLRAPVLVFPVSNFTTYESLPGMINYSIQDASLPNAGFISYITAVGGIAPSQWDDERKVYSDNKAKHGALRDVLIMKPRSTAEDVFLSLKNMGALEGEFVRAEAACNIGDKSKPISKSVAEEVLILKLLFSFTHTYLYAP